ncbi:probable terpene synthase 2, partial [Carica papaya]|uniref:probable terpene synthase 2 n=1 Tax=Carica papaya TaxID=3649 RepID=UPI000B8C87CD
MTKPAEQKRPSGNYQPSRWGNRFLSYDSAPLLEHDGEIKYNKLKEEVKQTVMTIVDKPLHEKLIFIDALQQLGISYHFESQIDQILKQIYETTKLDNHVDHDDDLYIISLQFRLLRQQGYRISSGVFNKFTNENGDFEKSLTTKIVGMLELYEASHLLVHGEDILEEALIFTTTHLELASKNASLSNHLAEQVAKALKRPIRKAVSRLEAKRYISIYQQNPSHNETLLNFAKLDFNFLQSLYKKELSELTRWWNELDITTNAPFARHRLPESYFWLLGICFEPQYTYVRKTMAKMISIAILLDDVYDAYGVLEELEILTDMIKRWDTENLDELPKYIKFVYRTLLDFYEEVEQEMTKRGSAYRVEYIKQKIKEQVQVYITEARWYNQNYTPPTEDCMEAALISCCYPMFITSTFVAMGDIATKEILDWVSANPKIVIASAIVSRLMGDIVSHT